MEVSLDLSVIGVAFWVVLVVFCSLLKVGVSAWKLSPMKAVAPVSPIAKATEPAVIAFMAVWRRLMVNKKPPRYVNEFSVPWREKAVSDNCHR